MSAYTWGTLARKSVETRPISGRLRAASMKRAACSARNSGEPPLRSCSCRVKPAPVPRPGMAGGPKATATASGICWANALLSAATTPFACASAVVALLPLLELDEEEALVRGVGAGDQAVAGDRVVALDRLVGLEDGLGLLHHQVGALERGGVGQVDLGQQVALVLLGDEARGDAAHQAADQHREHADEDEAAHHLADEDRGERHVGVGAPAEDAVEPAVERRQERLLAGRRLEHQRGERRATGSAR